MPSGRVEVAWRALENAWRRAEFEQLWVQFRPAVAGDAVADVEAAVAAANDAAQASGIGTEVFGEGVSTCENGPVVLLSRTGPEGSLRAWVDTFAGDLERSWSGTVTAAPEAHLPAWLSADPSVRPQLAAFISWRTIDLASLDAGERRSGWHVPAEMSREITRTAQHWGSFDGAETYLTRNGFTVKLQRPDVGDLLADGALRFGIADLSYLRTTPRRFTWTALQPPGLTVTGLWDDEASWVERLDRLRELITTSPEQVNLAMVRRSAPGGEWGSFGSDGVRPPSIRPGQARTEQHLHDRFVPDAHGLQVLTDAHLARASDLSSWRITPLGSGRHLVEATDPEPWFAHDTVDPAVLDQARTDFGHMVLTAQVAKDNPPPWKRRA